MAKLDEASPVTAPYPQPTIPTDMPTGWIQQMLLDGELKTGDRIPSQRVLSEKFSVSLASVREVLLTLETLGLIKAAPGRGTFVTAGEAGPNGVLKWRYSDSFAMAEVFETCVVLESPIIEDVARAIDSVALAALRCATDEMESCWAAGDLLANVEADLRFHSTIAQAANQSLSYARVGSRALTNYRST